MRPESAACACCFVKVRNTCHVMQERLPDATTAPDTPYHECSPATVSARPTATRHTAASTTSTSSRISMLLFGPQSCRINGQRPTMAVAVGDGSCQVFQGRARCECVSHILTS